MKGALHTFQGNRLMIRQATATLGFWYTFKIRVI